MPQLTSLDLSGTLRASAAAGALRCEWVPANAGNAVMKLHAVG
jgi:hypothetical protein